LTFLEFETKQRLYSRLVRISPKQNNPTMKFATVAATAFLASSVSAGLFSTNSVSIYDDNFPVPGENPLKHCQDPAEDVLDVISVDLNPNPPRP
jgi:hypothetical protein